MLRVTCNGRHGQFDGAAWLEGRHKVFYDEGNGAESSSRRALFVSEFAALAGVWDKRVCARFIRLVDTGESFEEYRVAKGPERRTARERKALLADEGIHIVEADEQSPRGKRALNKHREALGLNALQGGGFAPPQEVTQLQGGGNAPQGGNAGADVSKVEQGPDSAPHEGRTSRKRTRKGKEKVGDLNDADVSTDQDDEGPSKRSRKGKEKVAEDWVADVIMPPACECGGETHATFECPLCGDCCDCEAWALAACSHVYCATCLVRAIKASVADSKLFQCVTCELEGGQRNGITEPDVELLCEGRFRERALHEVLRDYVMNSEGGVVCGSCGEANLVSDVTDWDDLRCLACGGYMMGKRIAEEAADKEFDKWKTKHKHATCPKCGAVVQKTAGCNHMSCRCGVAFCYQCSDPLSGYSGTCKCHKK